jgi:N-acetylneuraminic acid mutarotase
MAAGAAIGSYDCELVAVKKGTCPNPRNFHSATKVVDGEGVETLYIIGGKDANTFFNDVWRIKLKDDQLSTPTWEKLDIVTSGSAKNDLTPRSRHSAVLLNNRIYVFGGVKGGDDLFSLDLVGNCWIRESTTGRAPTPRFGHCAAAMGKNMWIYGGSNAREPLNDLYKFDSVRSNWRLTTNATGEAPPTTVHK